MQSIPQLAQLAEQLQLPMASQATFRALERRIDVCK
jgi:hypothetical protein